ncbi:N-acyl-D-amino-acid deacylase family protein [Sandaracinus amylolyticus]|uniref:D-aminoacylase n=1 Tax=Sandaracinus amylolyticus TaxID=927083 RepID=A0A0F6YHS7_9BACT|nr:D-aminoacylase [Sandaracinus amylolyticus]AKF05420.1 D-aminoacylase [Sandaracinus amylolyticus]
MRLLLRNATIIDGTGAEAEAGDVLLEDDHIAELGATTLAPDEVIDARGLVVTPGFIDVHSHSDFTLPGDPEARAKVMQGVTSEVVGNCGLGLFPSNETVERFYALLSPMLFGEPGGGCFRDIDAYRARLEERGVSVNVVPLVPHGNVRCQAMGLAERAARPDEIARMRDSVDTNMRQGAFGLSTGLVYAPGAFADTEEIVELAKVSAAHGGIYASHMRDEGSRLVQSVEETLRIGREAKIPVQISHHKAADRWNWGKVETTLAMVDRARAEGLDVHSDVYPYTAGSTVLSAMFLPLWAFEGSQDRLLERLRDPKVREQIVEGSKERMMKLATLPGVLDRIVPKRLILPFVLFELSRLVVVSSLKNQQQYEGMTLREIAKARKQKLYDMLLDLLVEEELAIAAIAHVMSEDDVQRVMAHDATMIGTDGFPQREGKPHPRAFGTYARVIEHYVRERRLFGIETAIHKMTGMVAKKLGLRDRGVLRAGAKADVVVLDAARVKDRATYASPKNHPEGIVHVFVNGVHTVKNGKHTGARGGRVLHRAG